MRKISLGRVLVIILLLSVAFQVLYPLGMLFYGSIRDAAPGLPGNFSLDGYSEVYSNPQTYELLWRTFWLAIVRTILAVCTAIFLAWAVTRTNIPFKRFFEWSITFMFFMPFLPKILAWVLLASPRTGFLNQFLRSILPLNLEKGPLNIYSYEGIIFVSVLLFSSFLFVLLVPAFRAMDVSLEESSRMSGASLWTTIFRIDIPLMSPVLLAALVLGFVRMMESFVVEAILGIPANIMVFTTKIYDYVRTEPPEYPPAMALAVTLLVITIVAIGINRKLLGQKEYTTVTGRGFRVTPADLGLWKYAVFSAVMLFVILGLFLPLAILIWGSFMKMAGLFTPDMYTLNHYRVIFQDPELARSIWNTLIMATACATFAMLLSSLIAYVVVKTNFRERGTLDFIAWIPWAIPGIVMALGFLWAYILLPMPFGIVIYGTLALMTFALIAKSFPLGTRTMTSTIIQLSNELEEASRVHGASWTQTFRRIVLPLVSPGFIAGWILLFTMAVKDLATIVLLYSPQSTVMSTVIFHWWENGQIEEATVLGLLQAAMIAIAYIILNMVSRRTVSSVVA